MFKEEVIQISLNISIMQEILLQNRTFKIVLTESIPECLLIEVQVSGECI